MTEKQAIYELSICARVAWQAHSASNAGNNGSNRLMPRHQLLADGHETDACSGNIAKHHHAVLLAEYLEAAGSPLCPACSARDGRRSYAGADRENVPQHASSLLHIPGEVRRARPIWIGKEQALA